MKKLIELGVAIDIAIGAADEYDGGYNFERDRKIRDALMALPTVDAAPVRRGYWIRHDYADIVDGYYVPNYECSVCHAWKQDDSDYCPDCGARLDGRDCDHAEGHT